MAKSRSSLFQMIADYQRGRSERERIEDEHDRRERRRKAWGLIKRWLWGEGESQR